MLHGETLWDLIEQRADVTPDALMIVDEDMRVVTFAEFWNEAEVVAAGLVSAGMKAGDVVSWQLPTWIESMVLAAALSRLGVIQNPILPIYGRDEVKRMVTSAGSRLLVVPRQWEGRNYESVALKVAGEVDGLRILVVDGALPQGDTRVLPPPRHTADEDAEYPVAPGWIFFTPCGSPEPRGVLHDDLSLAVASRGLVKRLGLIARDRNALVFPFSDITGIIWLFASLQSGCANILVGSFNGPDAVEVLSREGVTLAGWGTRFHKAYVREQRRSLHPVFPDIRAFLNYGPAKPRELVEEVRSLFGAPILSGYGPVETPLLTMADISDSEDDLASSEGRPVQGVEVRLTDAIGQSVQLGDEGELSVRAPQMMLGYLDPADALGAFDDDGFFRTGDLARMDQRGNLVITGRVDDLVIDEFGDLPRLN